jgi:hypothetical protein
VDSTLAIHSQDFLGTASHTLYIYISLTQTPILSQAPEGYEWNNDDGKSEEISSRRIKIEQVEKEISMLNKARPPQASSG